MSKLIIYDYPLNEVIRTCLRLEQLFQHINHQLNYLTTDGTRQLMTLIINILHILDRPDLKTKLAKELSTLLNNLQRFQESTLNQPLDPDTTTQLNNLIRNLIDSSGKIGQNLREIDLLNNLRTQLTSPGGGCSFDLPLFHYWLNQNKEERKQQIITWLKNFDEVNAAIHLLLKLVRQNSKPQPKLAVHGFYQELLDPQSNLRMLRVSLDQQINAYPEISVGRHFLSVRFFNPSLQQRPTQYIENVTFHMTYCSL